MRRLWRSWLPSLMAATVLLALMAACDPAPAGPPEHLTVYAVSGDNTARSGRALDFESADIAYGHIDSAPPTSLTFTLKRILLLGTFDGGGTVQNIWDEGDGVQITVSGNGAMDLSGVPDIADLPVGTVTGVKLVISPVATMIGSMEANFADGVTETVYTKAALAYNALDKTGGGDAVADFTTGPAEEIETYFNGGDNLVEQEIECPVSYTLEAGANPGLTILFDVSRALRFYDGLGSAGQGPSPDDVDDKAYFFSHSVLTNSIVCFFGEPGSVQGYETLYDNSDESALNLIPGWMTLIYDASGDIQSGLLIGDDDNAGTVLKGLVTTATTVSPGVFDFTYDISDVTVTGFEKVDVVDTYDEVTWDQDDATGTAGGMARYTLRLDL